MRGKYKMPLLHRVTWLLGHLWMVSWALEECMEPGWKAGFSASSFPCTVPTGQTLCQVMSPGTSAAAGEAMFHTCAAVVLHLGLDVVRRATLLTLLVTRGSLIASGWPVGWTAPPALENTAKSGVQSSFLEVRNSEKFLVVVRTIKFFHWVSQELGMVLQLRTNFSKFPQPLFQT